MKTKWGLKTIQTGKYAGKPVRVIQRKVLLGVSFVQVSGKEVPLLMIKESLLT